MPSPYSSRRLDPVLAAIVVLAGLGGGWLLFKSKNWGLMSDELLYSSMGRSIAHTIVPLPEIRGASTPVYQVLYPALIAPLVGPIPMPDAYPWLAVLNGWLFALAAIPAYLLASYATGSRGAARWVALCTVITPWLIFGSKVLPDASAYLIVTTSLYAIARTASGGERPLRGDLLTLLCVALAYFVRTQFLLLLGVWLGTVVLSCAATAPAGGGWRALTVRLLKLPLRRPVVFLTFGAVALIMLVKPIILLGLYVITAQGGAGGPVATGGLPRELIHHLSVLGLGAGILPIVFGLPWLVTALTRVRSRAQNDAAIMIALATAVVIYVGANFDLRFDPGERVIERYIFYLGPLLFVAMAGFFAQPPKRVVVFAASALVAILLLGVTSPYGLDTKLNLLINSGFAPTQITFIAWQKVADAAGTSIFGLATVFSLIVCVFAWWAISSGRAALARNISFSIVAAVLLASTLYTVPKIVDLQNSLAAERFGHRTPSEKRWVDLAVHGDPVSILYSKQVDVTSNLKARGGASPADWWDVAFWNKSIASLYTGYAKTPLDVLPIPGRSYRLVPDWESGRVTRVASDRSSYLLMTTGNPNFAPQSSAQPIRRSLFTLYKPGRDIWAAWATRGLTLGGWVPPSGATLRVWAPRGADAPTSLRMTLIVGTTGKHADPTELKVSGARAVKIVRRGTRRASYSWTTTVQPGAHDDFGLERGKSRAHIDRISVTRG